MYPKFMIDAVNQDFDKHREDEWQELLRRPDAEPLPPEPEPGPGLGTRFAIVVRGWLLRLAYALPAGPAGDDEASTA
jgi:hypothetical protein